jgi:penicillin-binding protein 2
VTGDSPRLRLSILGIVVLSLFAALFARLWYLQVMVSDEFQVAAEVNRVREVPTQAPRGRILDRNGTVLVDNRVSIQVTVDRAQYRELSADRRREVLELLAFELTRASVPTTVEDLEARIADRRYSPYVPVPVAANVSEDLKIWIDENASRLPSVTAERIPVRSYPYGHLAAHVLGYVGKINPEEFEAKADSAKPYTLNDDIGKAGVERLYEDELRGRPGVRRIEVDAEGTPVRVIDDVAPVPGNDVVLSVDVDVQAVAERVLAEGLDRAGAPVGSTVVVDPRDGAVVAMASYPAFNPANFIDGISTSEWAYLNDPANRYPLNNWAIQGQYAPGSTFKPFVGYAGLVRGLVTEQSPFVDSGAYTVPNCRGARCTFRNAGGRSYGTIDLRRAMAVSSNAYFAEIGARFWFDRSAYGTESGLQDAIAAFGFGERHGIDLPSEQRGRIPSPQQRREFCEQVECLDSGWYTGDNVNMALGQGDVLLTPLQIANGYATLANGGTRFEPRVAMRVLSGETGEEVRSIEPVRATTVEMPPEVRNPLVEGMVGVTASEGGTAYGSFLGFPNDTWPVAGKTGTSQVRGRKDFALFAAFAPLHDPQYAISVVMEEAGFGGAHAAPVARRILDVLSGNVPLPSALDPDAAEDLDSLPDPSAAGIRIAD